MIYEIMFYGGFALAGLLLAVSVFLFFKLHIAAVIGDVTGLTRKKQIKRIQQTGAAKENDNFYSQAVGLRRGETLRPHSGRLEKRSKSGRLFGSGKTEKTFASVSGENVEKARPAPPAAQEEPEDTEVTEPLAQETAVLSEEEEETQVLSAVREPAGEGGRSDVMRKKPQNFEVITEIVSIHSEETIR